MQINHSSYGQGDATYRALGGFSGVKQLVDAFYTIMDGDPAFSTISAMHSEPDALKREKLTYFLCGWTGGRENYGERFAKNISMPGAHAHLSITEVERDQWLACMQKALIEQDYPEDLQTYLLQALSHPAEMVRRVSQLHQQHKRQKYND